MYYVALTRAKKTEFIFAYNTLARPKIQGDYEKIIKDLTAKAANTAAGQDDDDDDDIASNGEKPDTNTGTIAESNGDSEESIDTIDSNYNTSGSDTEE